MRGAGIFEGVQCCRVDLSGLFADDNQSDWRPKNFHNYVRETHLGELYFNIMMININKVFGLMGEGDRYIHDNRDENLGKPLFEMCCYHIWAFSCFRGGQNACQDDLCTFSSFWQCKKNQLKK